MNTKTFVRYLMILGLTSFFNIATAETAGRVLVAVGDVSAIRDGKNIPLSLGSVVESGDSLRTGTTSNTQVRLTDGAIISLRPQTEFRLDMYHFNGQQDGSEKGFFSLLKGGFRTVSGLIGKTHRDNYRVNAVTATIGIRGTDYSIMLCAQDCLNADGGKAKDGLYGRVANGRINVANESGDRDFGASETFFVADTHTAPQSLVMPPSFLSDKLAGQTRNQNRGGGESAQITQAALNADGRTQASDVPLPFEAMVNAPYVAAENINASGGSAVLPATNNIEWQLAYAFAGSSQTIEGCNGCTESNGTVSGNALSSYLAGSSFSGVGGGSLTDQGNATIDGTSVYWGRWSNATVSDPWNSGTPPTGLHYILTGGGPFGSLDSAVLDAKSGLVTYSFVDGTRAWDSNGNVGTKMSGSLAIDFTGRTIAPDVSYSVGGTNYHLMGFSMSMPAGQIGFNSDASANGTGWCSGGVCTTGKAINYVVMNTTLVGQNGNAAITGLSTAVMPTVTGSPVSTAVVGLFKAP